MGAVQWLNLTAVSLHVKLIRSADETPRPCSFRFTTDRRAGCSTARDHLAPGRGCFARPDHDHGDDRYSGLPLGATGFFVRFEPSRKLVHPPNLFPARAGFGPRRLGHDSHHRWRLYSAIASHPGKWHISGGDCSGQSSERCSVLDADARSNLHAIKSHNHIVIGRCMSNSTSCDN